MLALSFVLLCAAALMGVVLAILYLRGSRRPPPLKLAPPAHGALGAVGLAAIGLAIFRGLPPSRMGTGGFAPLAAGLFAAAFALGLAIAFSAWRRGRPTGALVGAHASLAVAGLVVLLALVALG